MYEGIDRTVYPSRMTNEQLATEIALIKRRIFARKLQGSSLAMARRFYAAFSKELAKRNQHTSR